MINMKAGFRIATSFVAFAAAQRSPSEDYKWSVVALTASAEPYGGSS